MKKIILFTLVFLLLAVAGYLIYLNETVLPDKIKETLVAELKASTGKRVLVESAKFDIFRGLVVKGLIISDEKTQILSAKDISCRFLILPIFKKEVVVTAIKFDSPKILVERSSDNSINIVELFFKKPFTLMDGKLNLTISRVVISDGEVMFRDNTFQEPFTKLINNVDVDIRFKLPDRINFIVGFEMPSQIPVSVRTSGEYMINKKELTAKIEAKDLYPMDFVKYCDPTKFKIPDGRMDVKTDFLYKDQVLDINAQISGMDMKFTEGKIEANLNAAVKAKIKYNFSTKEIIYSGTADVNNLALHKIDVIDSIYDIRGQASFSDKNFILNNATATVMGQPVRARVEMGSIQGSALKIDIQSDVKLHSLKSLLKEKFKIEVPLDMEGDGKLDLNLLYKNFNDPQPQLKGSMTVNKAVLRSEYGKLPVENVTGKFDFTYNQLIFNHVSLRYGNIGYFASGVITNFQKPGVQLELVSYKLTANTLFSISDKAIVISSLKGHYNDYAFSVQGNIDTSQPKEMKAKLNGSVTFELSDDKEPYKNFKDKFKNLKLSGLVRLDFIFNGDLNDIAGGVMDAEIKCGKLSVNNFKFNDFVLSLTQSKGISNIKYMRSLFYGGSFESSGLIDFNPKDARYQLSGDIKGVKIEDIRKDTEFKDKEVSGVINGNFGIKGVANDLAALNAWGRINISKGKLWQLNLFRGIGTLIFKSDFSSVIFEEGSFDFIVKDKNYFINDIVMKSPLINLYGTVKISFDRMIAASFKAEFTDEGVDAARTDNIAGAIERYAVIEVKGSLDDPKCILRPDLSSVAKDIADTFFSQ